MSRHLPPLNWLRAFEAAARHLSFTRAAEELNVTQAAVSQHVKALEERLGLLLFRRTPQGLMLTDAGQAYLPRLRDAFDLIARGTRELYSLERQGSLTVRVPSSLSLQWLVPRLQRFHRRHPQIDIRMTALGQEVDFSRDDIDMEIRYGNGRWSGLEAVLIGHERVFPVCSPALAANEDLPLHEPRDLARHTLLHVTGYPHYREDWGFWLHAFGLDELKAAHSLEFDQSAAALQAAVNSVGVALGRSPIVSAELAAGRLVAPFPEHEIVGQGAYWLVYPSTTSERPKLAAFREWLLEEARTDSQAWVIPESASTAD
ncbi:MAG TPA: transcriptional regulator GcvA [Candidatus Competibacteraceae bacterium]|nr:transcriptional regulator GcvA [Candidatus Competibacteraceae bacterium]